MTTLTMRIVKGNFIVTGPDIAPMKFKSRREAQDWCKVAGDERAPWRWPANPPLNAADASPVAHNTARIKKAPPAGGAKGFILMHR
jgi:hypothetical protein